MPAVSILTPCYHASATIARAVQSVIAQDYHDWEMILSADDGMDYAAILAQQGVEDKRLRFTSTGDVGTGPSHARNIALNAANGELIFLLDSDDAYAPTRLSTLAPLVREHGVAADNAQRIDHQTNTPVELHYRKQSHAPSLRVEDYLSETIPFTMLWPFRRDCIQQGWDEDIGFAEDFVFNLRFFNTQPTVPVLAERLYHYYLREGSLCHAPDSGARVRAGYQRIKHRAETDGLGIHSPTHRAYLVQVMEQRLHLNQLADAAIEAGTCKDFYEFAHANPELFVIRL